MTCEWDDGCGRQSVGWRFWPGADNDWDPAKPGWRKPPWLAVCGRHLPRKPHEFALAT